MEDKIVYVMVSVENGLPIKEGHYLVKSIRHSNFEERFFNGNVFTDYSKPTITHWLKPTPLSELLKEKDEQIKELLGISEELMKDCIDKQLYPKSPKINTIKKAQLIIQKHNAVTKQ